MEDSAEKRIQGESKQVREERRAARREIRDIEAALPDARRLKRNRHGVSSWEDSGDDYERGVESDRYQDGYGSYGHGYPAGWWDTEYGTLCSGPGNCHCRK